jgi:uncharacterized protein DUF3667
MITNNTPGEASCLNCNSVVIGNFCSNCGQKKEVSKLTWTSLINELFHFLSHLEKGFINTSFQLLIRPDKVIGEYLNGKRKKYFKPLSLFLIWVSVHLLVYKFTSAIMNYENIRNKAEIGDYVVKHTALFGFFLIPILSFLLWLIVSRPKLNYIETFTAVLYCNAAIEMLITFQIIIKGIFFRSNFLTNSFPLQIKMVSGIWGFYCMVMFFSKKKIKYWVFRILLVIVIGLLIHAQLSEFIAVTILRH